MQEEEARCRKLLCFLSETFEQHKGSDVAISYDGQFRLQGFSEGVAWDDFQYDMYEECQSFCEAKQQRP